MPVTRRALLETAATCGLLSALGLPLVPARAYEPFASSAGGGPFIIADRGVAFATIVVDANAGLWERRAAEDLAEYVHRITGVRLQAATAAAAEGPLIVVGRAALRTNPSLAAKLQRIAKSNPVVQADAIIVRRDGQRLYIAGSNDESHYFAVSWLLQHWGCRWYMPTDFGEHVPRRTTLAVDALDHVHAPPFELRHYWLSWNGDSTGADAFRHRNFMSSASLPGAGQVLDQYTAALAPPGGSHFNVPFADPATAKHVANRVDAEYAAGRDVSLAIADGLYSSDDARDRALVTQYDRYMLRPSVTDAMLTLYNNVAAILRVRHPASRAKIGGLAYANATLPPRIVRKVEPNLVMWIAPIDIDPNHAMDDPRSPPRQAYGHMVQGWTQVVDGRLAIYDYDQSMLVWRDLPNPSHHVFARDVKLYRAAGILGFGTESRGAFATTFLNLFFRGQMMWNPDADVGAMLRQFYADFYGPPRAPMAAYWTKIFTAWEATDVTEHEHPAIPAIYTPALVTALRRDLERAEALTERPRTRRMNERFGERLRFTRLGFEIIANYVEMVSAAAAFADYPAAVRAGEKAIAARLTLAGMSPIFTTRVLGPGAETAQGGAAWLAGEVQQMRDLAALTGGVKGSLVEKLPATWAFRQAEPMPQKWTYAGPEGPRGTWDTQPAVVEPTRERGWRQVRSDLYLQAQGIRAPDGGIELGHYWYQSSVSLPKLTPRTVRLMFPGLFNEAWLYINGAFVAHRPYAEPWWRTDYKFEWDVDVTGHLRAGRNVIALRGFNPHHFAGIFRRPFLYRPA